EVLDMQHPATQRIFVGTIPDMHELGADAHLQTPAVQFGQTPVERRGQRQHGIGETHTALAALHVDQIHARTADEIADEGVPGTLEQLARGTELDDLPAIHHRDLVGEGGGLQLIVGDVDHGDVELLVDLLELAPQLPLQVRVDHRQRLVEENRRHVLTYQAAAHGDLLLLVGGEV